MAESNNAPKAVCRLRRQDLHAHILLGKSDYDVVTAYKDIKEIPRTAVIHDMILQSSICWEENHEKQIADLKSAVKDLTRTIIEYQRKYGSLSI